MHIEFNKHECAVRIAFIKWLLSSGSQKRFTTPLSNRSQTSRKLNCSRFRTGLRLSEISAGQEEAGREGIPLGDTAGSGAANPPGRAAQGQEGIEKLVTAACFIFVV